LQFVNFLLSKNVAQVCLSDFETVPLAPVIAVITFVLHSTYAVLLLLFLILLLILLLLLVFLLRLHWHYSPL